MAMLKLLPRRPHLDGERASTAIVAEREARIRRLVDANIIGIIIWDLRRSDSEAN
jgi:hypothetical protein